MNDIELTKEKPRKHVEIAPISKEERNQITKAVQILNTRRPAFYKQAIIEKAQSVLSSSSNKTTHKEASTAIDLVDGASFLSGGEK